MNRGPEARAWPYIVALLLLPALVLWRQDNPLFTSSASYDPWFYLGFFKNLVNFKRDLIPETYYGSRMSWLLPGFILHSIFGPVLATVILHLGVLYTGVLSLFAVLRMITGNRRAFLTCLVFAVYPPLWSAVGMDYVDGAAVAYSLFAMAMLTIAAMRLKNWRHLLFAGASIAFLVSVNLFWAVLCPVFALHYVGVAWWQNNLSPRRVMGDLILGCGSGFLAGLLVLCTINYAIDGSFWFFAPSVRAASVLSGYNPWFRQPWSADGLLPWLWLPAVLTGLALVAIPFLLRNLSFENKICMVTLIEFLLVCAMLTFLQFKRHMAVLAVAYYASTILPFEFLAAGTLFWKAAWKLPRGIWLSGCIFAALLFAVVWGDYANVFTPVWPHAVGPAAVVCVAALALALALSRRPAGILAGILGFACLTAEGRYILQPQETLDVYGKFVPPHANRQELERIMKIRRVIEAHRRDGTVRFWYDESEPAKEDYVALNSTYVFTYTLIRSPFPMLPCDIWIPPDTLLVVTTRKDRAVESALARIDACSDRMGLLPALVSTLNIESPFGSYTVLLIEMERDSKRWHTLQSEFHPGGTSGISLKDYEVTGNLPLAAWTPLYPDIGTTLLTGPRGLAVLGPRGHTDIARYGPLTIPVSGRYEFVLRVTGQSGKFAFGVVSGESWLTSDVSQHTGQPDTLSFFVDLQKGQTVDLRISNNNDGNRPVSLVVTGLSAVEVDRRVAASAR